MKKTIISGSILFIVGILLGKSLFNQTKEIEVIKTVESNSCLELKEKMLDLETRAKSELANINGADEKIQTMQKLYGEMFQLFLANVALKLDKDFWKDVGDSANVKLGENKECPTLPTPVPTLAKEEAETFVDYSETEDKTLPSLQLGGQEVKESSKFIYKSGKLKNPTDYYLASRPITGANNRMIQRIQGKFRGEALMKDPKGKTWGIFVNTTLSYASKKWNGDIQVELSDEEHGIFSRSSGQGENNNFNQHPDDPGSLLIEASPDLFLHLKWRNSRDLFNGYIYKKSRDNRKWTLVGYIPYLKRD